MVFWFHLNFERRKMVQTSIRPLHARHLRYVFLDSVSPSTPSYLFSTFLFSFLFASPPPPQTFTPPELNTFDEMQNYLYFHACSETN